MNGSASEVAKLNYTNDILEPLVSAVTDELKRKWLTKNARTRGESIESFYNSFRVVPPTEIAKLGDALIRNQILTANEMRGILGFKPSDQQNADMLMNPNMPQSDLMGTTPEGDEVPEEEEYPVDENGEEIPEEEYAEDGYDDAEEIQNGS